MQYKEWYWSTEKDRNEFHINNDLVITDFLARDFRKENQKDLFDGFVSLLCKMCEEIGRSYVYEDIYDGYVSSSRTCLRTFALEDKRITNGSFPYVGILGMYMFPDICNNNLFRFSEAFWYVEPKYRGSGAQLVESVECFIKQVITHENDEGRYSIEYGISDKRLLNVLAKKGYSPIKTIIEKKV